MTDDNNLEIPKIIIGSVKYPIYERIPDDHPLVKTDEFIGIAKRCFNAGAKAFLLYLHNDKIVELANKMAEEEPDMEQMFIIKYENIDSIINLVKKLKKKPLVLFLAAEISDQRDPDLINRFKNSLKKHSLRIGLYTREPIGTVSQMVTSDEAGNIFLMPFNLLGFGVQNRALLEMIVNSSENIYISSNPIAEGKIKTRQALEYISNHDIHGVLVDLEDEETMLETIKYANYFLGTRDFLQISMEFEDITEVCEYCGIGMERYYPPSKTGGSYFYCPNCGNTKQVTEVKYTNNTKEKKK